MLSKIFTATLIASSFLLGGCASAATPKALKKTVSPFVAKLVEYTTPLPYATVIERLDAQVNKTGSLTFASKFHAAKTKEEQTSLIADVTQGRNFLYFYENNHRAWLDIYDTATPHLSATSYTVGNPNWAFGIVPLDYVTGLGIPPRVLILEQADHAGTRVIYQQFSSALAPFSKDAVLKAHIQDLDTKFAAMIEQAATP